MELLTITPALARVAAGIPQTYATALAATPLAQLNGQAVTWQNLVGCAVQPNGELKDTASGEFGFGVSGAVSAQTIATGEGYGQFYVNSAPANPAIGYPFLGGAAFRAGLTTKDADCKAEGDVQFAWQIWEGGAEVWEAGVYKLTPRKPRNNALYRVGVEDGTVVWRVDGEAVYRSSVPPAYPLRFGAIFFHRNLDHIGGVPAGAVTLSATDPTGAQVPGSAFAGNQFTPPNIRGRYRLQALTANNCLGVALLDVLRVFPARAALLCPTQFIELTPAFNNRLTSNADKSAYGAVFAVQPERRWRMIWNRMPKEQADLLDAFFDEHAGIDGYPFFFFDYRANGGAGVMFNNVRFKVYERSHRKYVHPGRRLEFSHTPLASALTGGIPQ